MTYQLSAIFVLNSHFNHMHDAAQVIDIQGQEAKRSKMPKLLKRFGSRRKDKEKEKDRDRYDLHTEQFLHSLTHSPWHCGHSAVFSANAAASLSAKVCCLSPCVVCRALSMPSCLMTPEMTLWQCVCRSSFIVDELNVQEFNPQMHPASPRASTQFSPRAAVSRSVSGIAHAPSDASAASRAVAIPEGNSEGPITPDGVTPVAPSGTSVDHHYVRLQKENSDLSQQYVWHCTSLACCHFWHA